MTILLYQTAPLHHHHHHNNYLPYTALGPDGFAEGKNGGEIYLHPLAIMGLQNKTGNKLFYPTRSFQMYSKVHLIFGSTPLFKMSAKNNVKYIVYLERCG